MTAEILPGRHPGTQQLARWFDNSHLPDGPPSNVSGSCTGLAWDVIHQLPDSPELTAGLRKLLEAKDCFVRAAIDHAADPETAGS